MTVRDVAFCAAVLLAFAQAAEAQVALAIRAGTAGPSVGLMANVTEKVNLRLDVPYLTYDYSSTHQVDDFDLAYTTSLSLFSVSAIADVHPFGNGFRLSLGALYNDNEASFTGRSADGQTVGNRTYSPDEIGELSGVITPASQFTPYGGIGFGNALAGSKRFGFVLDIGVIYQGEPKVDLEGTGMIAPTAREEEAQIQENLRWAKFYPNVAVGITYRIR